MALAALSGDEQRVIFSRLCNVLDPGVAVAFGSASSELWELTQAPRQQLQAEYEAATALGRKFRGQSCKALREARVIEWYDMGLSTTDLATLGKLIPVLPALEELSLVEESASAGPDQAETHRHARGRRGRLGARRRPGPRRPAAAQAPRSVQNRHRQ